ncbi:hypothetical protein TEMA_18090 [Terrisporobacter mayombei]|uniref:Uncharacterized protein n=1 Tax=Terrisporobacter mayombei TaxID=1541 RepID=A0ABY9Q0J6_9FIRM|nr:hypothetical protein TEMA_18090 [Terrisporobacter mayombei]
MDGDPSLKKAKAKRRRVHIYYNLFIDNMNSLLWRDYYGRSSKQFN